MKKFVCLVVILMLSMSAMAFAAPSRSKTMGDLLDAYILEYTMNTDGNPYLMPVVDTAVAEYPEFEALFEIRDAELEKLMASESVAAYFGEVKDPEENIFDLAAIEAETKLDVFEMHPIIAGGFFHTENGYVDTVFEFPTAYESGEVVYVLIGIVNVELDEEQNEVIFMEWTVLEGIVLENGGIEIAELAAIVEDGNIRFVAPSDVVMAIQENEALIAIVSMEDEAVVEG